MSETLTLSTPKKSVPENSPATQGPGLFAWSDRFVHRHIGPNPREIGQMLQTCGFDAAQDELLTRSGPRMGEAARVLADCLASIPALPDGR